MKLDYNAFVPKSRDSWGDQALKELKGRPLETLNKQSLFPKMSPIAFKGEGKTPWMDTAQNLKVPRPFGGWGQVAAIYSDDLKQANTEILEQLAFGANALVLDVNLRSVADFDILFKDVQVDIVDLFFRGKAANSSTLNDFVAFLQKHKLPTQAQRGGMEISPSASLDEKKERLALYKGHFVGFKTAVLSYAHWADHGGSFSNEMALALSETHTFVDEIIASGSTIDDTVAMLGIELSVGQHYLMEIAKFRAFRLLWKGIVDRYEPKHECSSILQIQAKTSTWNFTARDEHSNLLRSTTAALSAVIGGADTLEIVPLSGTYQEPSNSHKRLALNIHHLLRFESYLDQVDDPARGSFYLESLTERLADLVWKQLAELEGMDTSQRSVYWKSTLENDRKEQADKQLLGVNHHEGSLPKGFERFIVETWESTFKNAERHA